MSRKPQRNAEKEPAFAAGRPLVRAALAWAARRHRGQSRAVDDAPFILHPVEVAALLIGRGCDEHVIAAGALRGSRCGHRRDGDRGCDDRGLRGTQGRAARARRPLRARRARGVRADKLAKTRELRAQAARSRRVLDDPALRRRREHYERSLAMPALALEFRADSNFGPHDAPSWWREFEWAVAGSRHGQRPRARRCCLAGAHGLLPPKVRRSYSRPAETRGSECAGSSGAARACAIAR